MYLQDGPVDQNKELFDEFATLLGKYFDLLKPDVLEVCKNTFKNAPEKTPENKIFVEFNELSLLWAFFN